MTKSPHDIAASIRARLFNLSRKLNEDFLLLLKRYAIERFLYRVGVSPYHDRFTLKGAMLFAFWGKEVYRTTRDLDLLGNLRGDLKTIADCISEIAATPVSEDGILFLPQTIKVEAIRNAAQYGGARLRIDARLGQALIPLQIDIGIGDTVFPPPQKVTFPTLLEGPPPLIQVYPKETVIAEKFHSVVGLGLINSRMKDFYDLYVLSKFFEFEGRILAKAIILTFELRQTSLPASLPATLNPDFFIIPEKVKMWEAFIDRVKLQNAPHNFSDVGISLRKFLWPLVQSINSGITFEAFWKPGGPW
jgi:hypothetical protein